MPLVIIAIIVIALLVHSKESNQRNAQLSGAEEHNRRKTNARLEHSTLDTYMKHGYSFKDAFDQTYKDMIAAGYEPCIPREAYSDNKNGKESSRCRVDVEKYDSFWVQRRREYAWEEWDQRHPGVKASPEEIDRITYDHYPTTKSEYSRDIRRSSMRLKAEPVGSFVTYPGLGTCEVIAHNWIGDGTYGGTYTLRVLKTGAIVTHIRIGDRGIVRNQPR